MKGETLLTAAGEMLLEHAHGIIDKYNAVNKLFMRFPNCTVKIAASDEVFNYVSTTLLGKFLMIHPEVEFIHTFMDEPDLAIKLSPSKKEKRMMELSYHPSSSFGTTRLWVVLSQILEPTLQ